MQGGRPGMVGDAPERLNSRVEAYCAAMPHSTPPARPPVDWRRSAGAWERWEPMIQHSLASVDPVLFRAARLRPGQRVLDLGCGSGDPAIAAARWVEPGPVLGLDLAPEMIAVARRRARQLGVRNAHFRATAFERWRPRPRSFDRVISRLAIMFADDPADTVARVRATLVRGGRAAFVVWAEVERNVAIVTASRVILPMLGEPPPDPEAGPHPMRFGKPGALARVLRGAGFRAIDEREAKMTFVYQSAEQFVSAFLETSSSARGLFARLPRRQRPLAIARMRRIAAAHRDGALVRLPGVFRVVSGTA